MKHSVHSRHSEPPPEHWRPARQRLVALALFVLLAFTSLPSSINVPNERSRLYLAQALVDDHSLSIDGPIARHGSLLDRASYRGRSFTDKAPGSSLVLALPYALLRTLQPAASLDFGALLALLRHVVMLPVAALGLWLFRRSARELGASKTATEAGSIAWLLGSVTGHYACALYGHLLVAVAGLFAWYALSRARAAQDNKRQLWWMTGVGASLGFACLTEYQAALLVPVFVLGCFRTGQPRAQSWLRLAVLTTAALPFVLALAGYQWACFGKPWELSYAHLAEPSLAAVHGQGVGGVTAPRLESLWGILLSHHRGLITTAPWVLALPLGFAELRRRRLRRSAYELVAICLLFVLFVGSSNMWVAGWGYGPRLLIPLLPFAALLFAVALDAPVLRARPLLSGLTFGLVGFAVLSHQLVQLVFPEPPFDAENPLLDVVLPLLRARLWLPNLTSRLLGVPAQFGILLALSLTLALTLLVAHGLLRHCHFRTAHRSLAPRTTLAFLCGAGLSFSLAVGLVVARGQTPTPYNLAGFTRWVGSSLAADPQRGPLRLLRATSGSRP